MKCVYVSVGKKKMRWEIKKEGLGIKARGGKAHFVTLLNPAGEENQKPQTQYMHLLPGKG